MLKVYKREKDVITIVITPKFKEVSVADCTGTHVYSAPVSENKYGSMGSYINSWLRVVNDLQPAIVME